MNNNKPFSILSFVLFSIAGWLILYTAWALYHNHNYISEMLENNQLTVSGNEYDILNFYMANSAQYPLFAIILIALGWMMRKSPIGSTETLDKKNPITSTRRTSPDKSKEEDFEEWFRNNDK